MRIHLNFSEFHLSRDNSNRGHVVIRANSRLTQCFHLLSTKSTIDSFDDSFEGVPRFLINFIRVERVSSQVVGHGVMIEAAFDFQLNVLGFKVSADALDNTMAGW